MNLSANSGISFGVGGAADSKGNLFFAWNDDSTGNTEIFVNPLLFVKAQPPSITGINPNSGAVGSDVTILGANFQGASAVTFGGNVTVTPANFTVSADGNQIATKVPQGAQTGPVVVTTALGTAMSGVFTVVSGDFAIAINPATQNVAAGASTSFTVNVQGIGNFTGNINLSAAVTPSDSTVTAMLSSASVAPGGNATLTVNTSASTMPTTFTVTVTGTSGQLTRTKTATVNVTSPDFSLAFNPASVTAKRGAKGQITVNINR